MSIQKLILTSEYLRPWKLVTLFTGLIVLVIGSFYLEMMREANFLASLPLYGLCGILWMYRGNVSQLYNECRMALHSLGRNL